MTTSQIISFNIRQFIRRIHGRVETAVYQSCERTLRSLTNRMKRINPYINVTDRITEHLAYDSLIQADCELVYPEIEMIPDIAKLQSAIDEMVQTSLSVSKMIPRWNSKGDYFATVLQSIPPIQFITKDTQVDNAFQTITLTKTQLD